MEHKVIIPNYELAIYQSNKLSGQVVVERAPKEHLSFALKDEPQNGTAHVEKEGYWVYIPNKEFIGQDTFSIEVFLSGKAIGCSTIKIEVMESFVRARSSQLVEIEGDFFIEEDNYQIVTVDNVSIDIKIDQTEISKDTIQNRYVLSVEGVVEFIIHYSLDNNFFKKRMVRTDEEHEELDEIAKTKRKYSTTVLFPMDYEEGDDYDLEKHLICQVFKTEEMNRLYHYLVFEITIVV